MIGKISGRVDYVAEDHALIEAGGVGYVVTCARRTLMGLRRGEWAALYTEFLVREDAMQLFGFETLAEREWHRLLTSVQGVGAKVALAILGSLGPDAVGRAIALGDAGSIRQAPGVGPKLAQRIVMELKEKAPAVMALGAAAARPAQAHAAPPPAQDSAAAAPAAAAAPDPERAGDRAGARADAMSALSHLGYSDGEAAAAVARAAAEDGAADAAALIRAALKALAAGA
jgi:Holliday junction DNA helicase RuvA